MRFPERSYQGKRILLICPSNNNYPLTIKSVLESRGATVHFYDERGNPSPVEKFLYRKAPVFLKLKIQKYYSQILKKEVDFNPDIVFVISPEAITKATLIQMKELYKNAHFIVFLWDAVGNKKLDDIFSQFDECFSFDMNDCKKYGFKFRPLFFSREYYREIDKNLDNYNYQYDFGFIGTLHSDRPRVINAVRKYCERKSLKYYFYFYVQSKVLLFYWLLKSKDVRELYKLGMIHTKTLPRLEAEQKMEATRCIIDVNHPKQNGLTMRTIEMLGLQRKLATTNKNISKYDFYNPVNQIIIGKDSFDIDLNTIIKPYIVLSDAVYWKYSVDYWIDEVLARFCN